jgi:hypothetical protein
VYLVFLHSVRRTLVTASVVLSSPIHVTLMIEALNYTETSVPTKPHGVNINEDAILRLVPGWQDPSLFCFEVLRPRGWLSG